MRLMFLACVLVLSLFGSLGLTTVALLLSPSDPARSDKREQLMHRESPKIGWAKVPRLIELIRSAESFTFGREPAVKTLCRGVLRTAAVQSVGLPAGWAAGAMLGLLLGVTHGKWPATVGVALLVTLVLIPAPIKVAAARLTLLETGCFSIGLNEAGFGAFLPAVFTLAVLSAPGIAIHQAVTTERARRRNDVVFARAVGLPWKVRCWLLWTGSTAFWKSQGALLLVSLVEGSLLVEEAFQVKGIGRAAFQAAVNCDAALLLLIVVVSCLLVDLGVLFALTRSGASVQQS